MTCWLLANVALVVLSGAHLPLRASTLAHPPAVSKVVGTDLMFLEVFALMAVVHVLTRRRKVPRVVDRAPDREKAGRETSLLLGYGVLAMLVGFVLGHALGWHAISFHLDGMVIRTGQRVVPAEALTWAAYNLIAWAVVPYVAFRRRYSNEELSLRSSNRRADLILVLVILLIESSVQLSLQPGIFRLDGHQLLVGIPLTFVLSFAGTVLPTMVFVCCILTPRYLRITGSVPSAVILGGVTYALLHFFDGWTNFVSPGDAIISVLYLLLFYTGPGMFKTFITIRSANAWTHVWSYHAIAPHTLIDTPMFTRIFTIR